MTDAMPDAMLALNAGFAAPNEAQWRALVDKILKGADFDKRLATRTADGVKIKPLYTRADASTADGREAARGHARIGATWDIRQVYADHDPAIANAAILEDLAGGVSSVTLQIAAPGWFGLDYSGPAIARALQGVMLDACPVGLIAGEYTPDAAGSLIALWRKEGVADSAAMGAFNYDPLGTLALTGALYNSVETALSTGVQLIAATRGMPHVTAMLADGHIWHLAGASEAVELAGVVASVVTYLRAAEQAGFKPADALGKIAVNVAVDADQFAGIAKLRALRVLLARIAEASGADASVMSVRAETSFRMMTRRDPWVNLLRATTACTAAAMGGAETITVLPFTWAAGRPDAFARRVARNTHHVLIEETGLGRVQDPAGGAWYVERLTDDLARAAWAEFQQIEAAGGLAAMLQSGAWQEQLAAQAKTRAMSIARGKIEITGTSAFPKLGSDGVDVEAWPREVLSADLPGARVTPIRIARDAEPFERLRDAADAATTKPRVFLATLGSLTAHGPRATWMRNFLAAGGIESIGDEPLLTSPDVGRAFADSGATVACIASSDEIYGALGEATAGVLKAAGATRVYLAGRPNDEAALRAAGVDGFIFAGADMIETLAELHRDLGIGAA